MAVISDYQYDDGEDDGSDLFMREPYGVLFSVKYGNGKYTSCNDQALKCHQSKNWEKKILLLFFTMGKLQDNLFQVNQVAISAWLHFCGCENIFHKFKNGLNSMCTLFFYMLWHMAMQYEIHRKLALFGVYATWAFRWGSRQLWHPLSILRMHITLRSIFKRLVYAHFKTLLQDYQNLEFLVFTHLLILLSRSWMDWMRCMLMLPLSGVLRYLLHHKLSDWVTL